MMQAEPVPSKWPPPLPMVIFIATYVLLYSVGMPLFVDPYAALCADVGPPTQAEWTHYAPGEPQPSVCR